MNLMKKIAYSCSNLHLYVYISCINNHVYQNKPILNDHSITLPNEFCSKKLIFSGIFYDVIFMASLFFEKGEDEKV